MSKMALIRHNLLHSFLETKGYNLRKLGNKCSWNLCLDNLNKDSVIVSAGAGTDISFEIELHKLTKARILLLDPSPPAKAHIGSLSAEDLSGITFLPYGLASRSGTRSFVVPANLVNGSYAFSSDETGSVSFQCRSLDDLMREYGWDHLDFLKMDIEGFEYEVLDSIFRIPIHVSQICLEFHPIYGKFKSGLQRYRKILAMRRRGYDLVHHFGTYDHTFVLRHSK